MSLWIARSPKNSEGIEQEETIHAQAATPEILKKNFERMEQEEAIHTRAGVGKNRWKESHKKV